jgi:hypothetical protein
MSGPSIPELLCIWERGISLTPLQRSLLLLSIAYPEKMPEELSRIAIGSRDSWLIKLRASIFGPNFVGLANCPLCGNCVEISFDARDVFMVSGDGEKETADKTDDKTTDKIAYEGMHLKLDGYEATFRLPNSLDLAAISGKGDVSSPRRELFLRCVQKSSFNGQDISPIQLPDEFLYGAAARMEDCDPQANIELNLVCPSCGNGWPEIFDIASFFWSEIDSLARRTLRDVHALASHYGWSEANILSMNETRRQLYLEMIDQ